ADREAFYGDPDFASVPIDGLLSKAYAATRIPLLREDEAWPEIPPAGDPWEYSTVSRPAPSMTGISDPPTSGPGTDHGTTHLAAIDGEGNIICATPSGAAFFKSIYFPELGLALSTRSEMFFVDEHHPNGIAPGKRPRTTLVNYMVCQGDQPFMTVGCPGGDNQAQSDIQIVLNVLVFGMNPQEAVEAPRFASQSMTNSFYPRVYRPGHLDVEPGITSEVQLQLEAMGHKVVEAFPCGYGATVTRREVDSGILSAGADNRTASYAIAW
ncbi:MAG: gamma-glutamyltransferase, partial [Dehalococcoidia bacterium]|nr:gamma-glutamyltransferase [Dehalococcoidia bacterium]